MTLCVAWIRQISNVEELIFATDSTLTGGEKWDNGIKLFGLSRQDCLLCFTGSTGRAYPLILNLVSAVRFDQKMEDSAYGITDVLKYIADLFTSLVSTINIDGSSCDIHSLRAEARFLFGGWCWQTNNFHIWKLYYSQDVNGFLFDELTNDNNKTRFYTFMGEANGINIEEDAKKNLQRYLLDNDKADSKLDMEPLKILYNIAIDTKIREVGGSLQIAKVYRSGRSEFFGIFWPSSQGEPYFQGRKYNNFNKPPVRYYDPDTCELFEPELPERLSNTHFREDDEFLKSYYPEGRLKEQITFDERYEIKKRLTEYAYSKLLKELKLPSLEDNE